MNHARNRQEALERQRHEKKRQFGLAAGIVLVVAAGISFMYLGMQPEPPEGEVVDEARLAALASDHAPTTGSADARVHIVEFLDPACETCALFFPMVKEWMNEVPGQIRLSVRHLAFHEGSEHALKVLEASRNQGKYWETLEALLASQDQWVSNHTVMPEQLLPALESVGLDAEKLTADMNSVESLRRIELDKQDAITLKISATPEYFVNGRPLPSFGRQQLADLVKEELDKAY